MSTEVERTCSCTPGSPCRYHGERAAELVRALRNIIDARDSGLNMQGIVHLMGVIDDAREVAK